jgi:hypothetical protein
LQILVFPLASILFYSLFTYLCSENIVGDVIHSTVVDSKINQALKSLQDVIHSPPDMEDQYTRLKKDIFHAFHMIPTPVDNGLWLAFLWALQDHILCWDSTSHDEVDAVCHKSFNLTFDQMLLWNPCFIRECTPYYAPPPSVLTHAIQFVIDTFGDAVDAGGNWLFSKKTWQKAHGVLELAKQGYLSDVEGVVLYEKAGIDKYGLQKWKCLWGTNNVEGGPHSDIYHKFGALHGMYLEILTDLDILWPGHQRMPLLDLHGHTTWLTEQYLRVAPPVLHELLSMSMLVHGCSMSPCMWTKHQKLVLHQPSQYAY